MANYKITDLPILEEADLSSADLLEIVDVSEDTSHKVTVSSLLSLVVTGVSVGDPLAGSDANGVVYADGSSQFATDTDFTYNSGRLNLTGTGVVDGVGGQSLAYLYNTYPSMILHDAGGNTSNNMISLSLIGNNLYVPIYNDSGTYQRYAGSIQMSSGNWAIGGYNGSAKLHIKETGGFPGLRVDLSNNETEDAIVVNNFSGSAITRFDSDLALWQIGNFTVGGGVSSSDGIITEKIIRATGGLNMRAPTVGDSIFTGVRLSGNGVAITAGSTDVLKVNNNGSVGTYAASIQRTYGPVVSSGSIASWQSRYTISSSAASTATFAEMLLNSYINQTGSHTSITAGIMIAPSLVSAVDYRAIWIGNNSGYGIYQGQSGADNFFNGKIGIGDATPTEMLDINSDVFRLRISKTPSSASDTGNQGSICWDADYVYVCTATDTWKRSALTTW